MQVDENKNLNRLCNWKCGAANTEFHILSAYKYEFLDSTPGIQHSTPDAKPFAPRNRPVVTHAKFQTSCALRVALEE
jgi:hypothetical protein